MKIVVGEGSCGIAAGAAKVYDKLASALDKSNELTITGCIGMCFLEPIVDIYDNGTLTRLVKVSENDCERIAKAVNSDDLSTVEDLKISEDDELFLKKQTRIALRHCGIINPEKISDYENTDGYKAVRKVLSEMTPEQVIEEIKISGLAGRGGAGFPTWFKWNAARSSDGTEKYLICNADEGDPGAFMDRAVIEGDPHNLIEGMLIGAYAIGAKEAIVYVRAEYPLAIKRLENKQPKKVISATIFSVVDILVKCELRQEPVLLCAEKKPRLLSLLKVHAVCRASSLLFRHRPVTGISRLI